MSSERWGFAVYRNGVKQTSARNLGWKTASDAFIKRAVEEQDRTHSNVQLLRRLEGRKCYETVIQAVGTLGFLWTQEDERLNRVLSALRIAGFRRC